jgi:hypothetical protein
MNESTSLQHNHENYLTSKYNSQFILRSLKQRKKNRRQNLFTRALTILYCIGFNDLDFCDRGDKIGPHFQLATAK